MAKGKQPLLVTVVGVGLVGAEFVDQVLALPEGQAKIVSLSSSKRVLYAPDGITNSDWRSTVETSSKPLDIPPFIEELGRLAKSGSKVVFIDNTSADSIASLYPQILSLGINVITPNKKAFSRELGLYEQILKSSEATGARFLNESTVGAGLPIISTLKDLVATGDTVTKIEGVFSGTMSYIFNNFSTSAAGGPSFSSVVKIARESGYTEPHPGDDLNGADVARKLTILSRIVPALRSALPDGYKSVDTRSLVPSALEAVSNGDEFMARLPEFDAEFDQLRAEAQKDGKVLRYVGVIDVKSKNIRASLEKYENTHAFATSLGGSDNIIMFHTKRYGARPLIVQGAGAGAAVTAMGVLSDLLKLTN